MNYIFDRLAELVLRENPFGPFTTSSSFSTLTGWHFFLKWSSFCLILNDLCHRFGMHENYNYYMDCKYRQRNQGLFTADQVGI